MAKFLDPDNNMLISCDSFIKAMTIWLRNYNFSGGLFKNDRLLILNNDDRKIFHYNIANFFLQNYIGIKQNTEYTTLLNNIIEKTDIDYIDVDNNLLKTSEEKVIVYFNLFNLF